MARGLDTTKLTKWQTRLAQFEESGLTVQDYCRQQKVSPAQFYYWLRRIREQPAERANAKKSTVGGAPTCAATQSFVEVLLGGDVRVRLPADDRDLVQAVVSKLHSRLSTPNGFQRFDLSDVVSVSR